MLGYIGPILGLCRAYVEPIEPILRPILSQENHKSGLYWTMLGPFWRHVRVNVSDAKVAIWKTNV